MPISMPTVVMLSTFHFNLLWLRAVQWDGATWRLMWLYTVHSPGCCAVPPCSGLVDGLPDVCQVPAVVLWAQCKNLFRTGKKPALCVVKKKAKTRIHVKHMLELSHCLCCHKLNRPFKISVIALLCDLICESLVMHVSCDYCCALIWLDPQWSRCHSVSSSVFKCF